MPRKSEERSIVISIILREMKCLLLITSTSNILDTATIFSVGHLDSFTVAFNLAQIH
jgi:hypothetical protein